MSYTEKPAQYEAIQLGSGAGAQDAFLTALGFTHGDGGWTQGSFTQAVENADGSVSFANPAYPTFTVAAGDWMVSQPHWGTFAGWVNTVTPGSYYPSDQFDERFISA